MQLICCLILGLAFGFTIGNLVGTFSTIRVWKKSNREIFSHSQNYKIKEYNHEV